MEMDVRAAGTVSPLEKWVDGLRPSNKGSPVDFPPNLLTGGGQQKVETMRDESGVGKKMSTLERERELRGKPKHRGALG